MERVQILLSAQRKKAMPEDRRVGVVPSRKDLLLLGEGEKVADPVGSDNNLRRN